MKRIVAALPWIGLMMMYGGIIAECFGAPLNYTAPIALAGLAIFGPFHWRTMR
ncbi:hypothetical protein [Ochrobactrum sp. 3-3]|uniref:hypothetical protein n=1 Tax=Ochrobactrum sp. 3-3 TaxID=1830124 RepID=UPI0013B4232F|nr:hypothetical protein [Ochrobactrum sp. 3-3]